MTREFTIDEWVCVELARTIRDHEVVFHGFGSPAATVAMHVAKRTHAPHTVLVEGSTYAVDPDPVFIPPTSNDWALMRGASHVLRFEELFDLAARGGLDRMFLSGAQIDPHGNTNDDGAQAFSQDHSENVAGSGSESYAYTDFAGAAADRVSHHAKDAGGCEQQRGDSEKTDENGVEFPRTQRRRIDLRKCSEFGGNLGVEVLQDSSGCRGD